MTTPLHSFWRKISQINWWNFFPPKYFGYSNSLHSSPCVFVTLAARQSPNNPKSIISGCSHLLYQAIRAKNAKSSDCTIWLQSDCQNCFAWASWLDWWPMSFPVDLPFESKIVTLSERRLHALLLCHVLETVDNGFSFFLLCL